MAYRIEYLDLGLRAAADLKRAALSISPDGDEGILADRASVKSATPCHACRAAMPCYVRSNTYRRAYTHVTRSRP